MRRALSLLLIASLLAGCAGSGSTRATDGLASEKLVQAYVAAFNRHDAAAAASLLAPDLQWLAIDNGQTNIEAAGRASMQQWLQNYFASVPDVRSEVETFARGTERVAVYECVSWRDAGVRQRRCAHGVFELRAGLIHRVWFWPAQSQ